MIPSGSLVLSLFPGIGLLDRGFEDNGFAVVRGPDLLWGGDVKRFHPPAGRFDGIIGGPPCQAFSRLRHIVEANGYQTAPNLIPEYERVVSEAAPTWFLMENVPEAPLPVVPGYQVHALVLNNRWVGGIQGRDRRFSFGTRDGRKLLPRVNVFDPIEEELAVTAQAGGRSVPVKLGGSGKVKKTERKKRTFADCCRLQGLPEDFDLPPFTANAKEQAVGNGVPYPLACAVARAVLEAFMPPSSSPSAL
jgi:DNA (cytosine-5)-methyltransferase 1